MEKPKQRPEGALIASALKRRGWSARRAASEVGISDTRLRNIMNGYQPVGRGQALEIVGPPETLALIARVLGISADQLREAGRGDAGDALDDLHRWPDGDEKPRRRHAAIVSAREELQQWLDDPSSPDDFPPTAALCLWDDTQLLQEVSDRLLAWSPVGHLHPGRYHLIYSTSEQDARWYETNRRRDDHVQEEAAQTSRAAGSAAEDDDEGTGGQPAVTPPTPDKPNGGIAPFRPRSAKHQRMLEEAQEVERESVDELVERMAADYQEGGSAYQKQVQQQDHDATDVAPERGMDEQGRAGD